MTLPTGIDWAALAVKPATPLRQLLVNQSLQFISGDLVLMGLSLREANGSANTNVQVFDGADNTAQQIYQASLSPLESVRDWFGPGGILCQSGLTVVVATGIVEVIAWWKDIQR